MTIPVHQRKLATQFQAHLERRRSAKNTGRSFSEEIQSRKSNVDSVPQFPRTRVRRQNISMGQAQKLARYAPYIQDAARRYNVPIELICGVILQESGGNPRAVSPAGARGLMQLMPQTARRFGVVNPLDPRQNIEGGTKYLRWLLNHFSGNVELTLAGYNAGEQNVQKYGNRIPPFRETQNYVPNVLGYALAMVNILRQGTKPVSLPVGTKLA